jgi:hypothetical protein
MYPLRRILLPLIALVTALALSGGGHALLADIPAGHGISATDVDCCHHAANVPCADACPMGAGIASAARTVVTERHHASVARRPISSPRSWARAPVTAPPKHFVA